MQAMETTGASVAGFAPPDRTAAGDNTQQFITFTLDGQEYGIDIMVVREIKGWAATTTIPNAPDYVRGVINLRGIIVPIFDLRSRFGMGRTNPSPMHVVIIVHTRGKTIGLLVDAVSDIITIEPAAIRPVPEMGLPTDDRFLDGLVAHGDRMVTLISLHGLFVEIHDPASSEIRATRPDAAEAA